MQTLVIYDSKFGNTERIAEAIGRGAAMVSSVRVAATTDAATAAAAVERPDLVLVGGPTHKRGVSAGLGAFVDALPAALRGVPTACFDTRYRGPLLLTGSAAAAAAKALARAGSGIVAPPESFYIVRRGPLELQTLESGEIDRAEAWGRAIAATQQAARAQDGVAAGV